MAEVTSEKRPSSARMTAYAFIRERIIRGELRPGELLSENDLAQTLTVSRQPVREALLLIAQEGLVEVRPQSGTYVTLIDPERVRQSQFIREAIELSSLDMCDDLTADQTRSLRSIVALQEEVPDREAFYPLDEEFHRRLLALAGHENAWVTVSNAKGHLDRARYLGLSGFRPVAEYAADHSRVVDALVDGDRAAARAELQSHLRFVLDDLGRIEEQHPEYFAPASTPLRRSGRPPRRRVG